MRPHTRSNINGLMVDVAYLGSCTRTPCHEFRLPKITTSANTIPGIPGSLTETGGLLLPGTGLSPEYVHLVTNQEIELILAPVIAGEAMIGPSTGSAFSQEIQGDQDTSMVFGVTTASGNITEGYDVTLTVSFDGQTRTLTLQDAPSTPQLYNWVDLDDPTYVVTDSATNADGTSSQNATRIQYLFPSVTPPAEGMQTYVLQATDKQTGQVLTNTVTLDVSIATCNTTDTDNGLVRFTAGNVGGQRTGLLRSVGSNPDMGEPDSPLPADWKPIEISGQSGLLVRIGVNPIGNEEYMGGTIQLMDEDCNPIGAPVGPITVNAASGLLGVYGANTALAPAFINGRVLSVQFIKPAPTPPDLQPDWGEDAVTFGFTPGQVSAQSAGVNYQETPTQPQAGTMLQPEPEGLVNIKITQFQTTPPGVPRVFSGHIASAPATYAGSTWTVIDADGVNRGTGATSYDPVSSTLTLEPFDDLLVDTKGLTDPMYVTITKA